MNPTRPTLPDLDPREGLFPAGCAALCLAVAVLCAIAALAYAIIKEAVL